MQNKRIVVKIGTSTLAHPSGLLNIRQVESLCKVLSDLKNAGHELILVSSGAIGMGVGKLSLSRRPEDMPTKQAAAAVGQCELMYTYDKLFPSMAMWWPRSCCRGDDIHDPSAPPTSRAPSSACWSSTPCPSSTRTTPSPPRRSANTTIGENDTLAAQVAVTMGADLLVILSDINGLYTADPHTHPEATLITEIPPSPRRSGPWPGASSKLGTGGMTSKLQAAALCTPAGCDMVITNGSQPERLYDIAEGKPVGSRFRAVKKG